LSEKIFNFIIKPIDFLIKRYKIKTVIRLKKLLLSFKANVIYIVEEDNWSIEWDGKYITTNLKKLGVVNAEISSMLPARKKIIHFGSLSCVFRQNKFRGLKKSNYYVLTWFHIVPEDYRLKFIPLLNKKIDIFHTSNIKTKLKMVDLGIDENKIIVIPLGVDLSVFKKFELEKKKRT
jgi:hypothetical protein